MSASSTSPDPLAQARRALEANPVWYHSIELAPGVVTPGHVDMRSVAPRILPDDLRGRRVLDVGTFDGFWAFEMERRGADVVAIDVEEIHDAEWPPHRRAALRQEAEQWGLELGRGFELASSVLGSEARRAICNVYDLSAEAIDGHVDFIFSGAILLHLRDPIRGLERIRSALRPEGELRVLEPFSVALTLRAPRTPIAKFSPLHTPFNWWYPNLAALRAWLGAAQFEGIRRRAVMRPPSVRHMRQFYACFSCRRPG